MYFSNLKQDGDFYWRVFLLVAFVLSMFSTIETTLAADINATDDVIGTSLCRLISNLTGNISRAIATMAIFSVGIGLFLGKVNWGIAAVTTAGVAIIFGAPQLVNWLAGGSAGTCEMMAKPY